MWEEGFQKIKVEDSETDTRFVRRSFYSHLSNPAPSAPYSCLLVFTTVMSGQAKGVMIQSVVAERFKHAQETVDSSGRIRSPDVPPPSLKIPLAARHWISNAYSGSLRNNVVEMYRDLHLLARQVKDAIVHPLKAIIAHGLDPPLLVGLEALPMEVLERLAHTLPTSEAMRLARTCKRLFSIVDRERLWRAYLLRDFKGFATFTEEEIKRFHGSWKECYEAETKRRNSAKAEQMRRYAGYTRLMPYFPLSQMHFAYPAAPPGFDDDDFF
ncbi:F-box only protein 7-like [Paramacrobiotus metropolitanus]|uniref:F-box only protein 7-like n=1 Tax=Paramacrobiotus metropolitanus TaxID=2943436 RepID=UPI002445A0A2|nr:F-box only protein 7-like [Paramacrobiotus metropolitanus]